MKRVRALVCSVLSKFQMNTFPLSLIAGRGARFTAATTVFFLLMLKLIPIRIEVNYTIDYTNRADPRCVRGGGGGDSANTEKSQKKCQ